MLNHLVFLVYLFSFLAGFASIVLTIVLFIKQASREIIIYCILLCAISLLTAVDGFAAYCNITGIVDASIMYIIHSAVVIFSVLTSMGAILFLSHRIVDRPVTLMCRILYVVYSCVCIAGFIFKFVIRIPVLDHVMDGAFVLFILYGMIFIAVQFDRITIKELRNALRVLFIVSAIAIPALLLSIGVPFPPFDRQLIFLGYYISFAIINCIFGFRYFILSGQKQTPAETAEITVSEEFLKRYAITGRENDILLQLIDGKRNEEIAENLNISLQTVKNNIHVIYKKAGVSSRTSLIKAILSFK